MARKGWYKAKRPETKRGAAGGHAKAAKAATEIISVAAPSFAADTAEKMGVTERSIRQDVQITESIPEDVGERHPREATGCHVALRIAHGHRERPGQEDRGACIDSRC